ncbi:general transcription factor IIH subunit 5 [Sarcoptes scabiei]|nr:general transcription factor IIH subunit 5 [Sarcoptes scabiei]
MSDNQETLSLEDRFDILANLFRSSSLPSSALKSYRLYADAEISAAAGVVAGDFDESNNHIKSFNDEFFIDLLIAVYTDLQRNTHQIRDKNSSAIKFCNRVKPLVDYINRLKLKSNDFDQLKVIGKGAFGQVSLVKSKHNEKVYAMKVLNKIEMTKRTEKACFKEERDILLNGSNDWFTKMHYAFQDGENLYLVMDYYIGGEFLTLLSKYDDTLPEEMCKFYATQMILAISALHDLGYIHRDIKPHNILIDSTGHIRLADFGSCVKAALVQFDTSTPVGTPDYISPEILTVIEGKNKTDCPYSYETDWWSLGIVIFESFYGEPPFYAESLIETYFKIMNHKIHFMYPPNDNVTDEAKDLISNLVTDRQSRYKKIDQFKTHPWFIGTDWDRIRYQTPPYQPEFSGPDDTSNFDTSDLKPINAPTSVSLPNNKDCHVELSFVGFSATFSTVNSQKEFQAITPNTEEIFETKNHSKVTESEHSSSGNSTMSMSEAVATISNLEHRLKSAQQEWSEMSHLLAEMKKDKNILSDKLRMKEQELDEHIDKNSQLRQQMRNFEKLKRQHLEEVSNLQAELEAQKIIRKQDQNTIKDFEDRIETMERQLQKHDDESSLSNSGEIQNFMKKINELEQQVLNLEEENVVIKKENCETKKFFNDVNRDLMNLINQDLTCEKEFKVLLELIDKESQDQDSVVEIISMLEYNLKRFKFLNDKNNRTNSSAIYDNINQQQINATSWQERRSAKVDKQELLTLQLELKSEITEKQKVQNELEKLQQEYDNLNIQLIDSRNEITKLKKHLSKLSQENSMNNIHHINQQQQQRYSRSSNHESDDTDSSLGPFMREYAMDHKKSVLSMSSSSGQNHKKYNTLSESNENFDYHNKLGHSFIIRTFITPIKCYICTSLMIGLVRQGYVCEVCGYACHVDCVDLGSECPFDEAKQRPVGIDPQKGIGTAYEGFVKIPKPRGGIRKGWIRMFVVVCDFKLFLYDIINTGDSSLAYANVNNDIGYSNLVNTPSVSASTIIDMRFE